MAPPDKITAQRTPPPPILQCKKGEYVVSGTLAAKKPVTAGGKRVVFGESTFQMCSADPKLTIKSLRKTGSLTKVSIKPAKEVVTKQAALKDAGNFGMIALLKADKKNSPPKTAQWGKPDIDKGQPTRAAGKPKSPPAKKATPQKTNAPRK